MTGLIDTHAHLMHKDIYHQIDDILKRAQEVGVKHILCICLNVQEAKQAFILQKQYPFIDIAVGFHPTDLHAYSLKDWEELKMLIQDDRICAVGEIGLDYHWDTVDKETQKQAFIAQLELANQAQKPVLIHMREATADTLAILKKHKHVPGIMHCFSGSLETARTVIDLDMYISVGGPLTFKNARGLPEVMAEIPIERMFVETDCPYLTPHPHRGKTNEPMYLPYTFEKLCEVKNVTHETLSLQMAQNYKHLFTL